MQGYSHLTSNMLEAPSLSTESLKGNIIDQVHTLNKNDIEEFIPPWINSPKRWEIKSECCDLSPDLSALVLPSIHYKCYASGFRPVCCLNNTREDCNKVWQYKDFCTPKFGDKQSFGEKLWIGKRNCRPLVVRKLICIKFILMPIGKDDNLFTECVVGCKDSVVISCTTFQNGIEDVCGSLLVLD
jgi:hypothetical protein